MTDPHPYAVAADITARWAGPDVPADGLINVTIADATAIIDQNFPDLVTRIGSTDVGGVTADIVKMVTCQMALRKLYNPRGARTITTGPFGATLDGTALGQMALTDEELNMLDGLPGPAGQRAFTINTTPAAAGGFIGSGTGFAGLDSFDGDGGALVND